MDNEELRSLLDAMRSGDENAFPILYHGIKTPVYTVIRRITGSRETAEDVMQTLFLKLCQSSPGPEIRLPRAWIMTMARNLALDALRRPAAAPLPEELAAPDPLPEDRLDLERALAQLEETERSVLTLHLSAGLPFREAAGVLGLSLPAAYRRYQRALQRLRALLEEEDP